MQEKQIIRKLIAHKKFIDSTFNNLSRGSSIPGHEFDAFVAPFEKARKELTEINPGLYGDFIPKPYYTAS